MTIATIQVVSVNPLQIKKQKYKDFSVETMITNFETRMNAAAADLLTLVPKEEVKPKLVSCCSTEKLRQDVQWNELAHCESESYIHAV